MKSEIEKKLWEVHEALIEHFLDILKNDVPKASTLDVIRAFLRDNAITRNEMKKTLPFDAIGEMLEEWNEEVQPGNDKDDTGEELKFAQ